MILVNNTDIEKLALTKCSASHQQRNFPCSNVLMPAGGWAFDGIAPAWVSVELISLAEVNGVKIVSVFNNDSIIYCVLSIFH